MEITFNTQELEAERLYASEIVRYELDCKLRIFKVYAVLDDIPELEFSKGFVYSLNMYSDFITFCEDMYILTPNNTANLERLIGTRVCVELRKDSNGAFFIREIYIDNEYLNELFDRGYDI